MKLVTIPTYVFFGIPSMAIGMRDDGQCEIIIDDTADKCGGTVRLSINARYAEIISWLVDEWNEKASVQISLAGLEEIYRKKDTEKNVKEMQHRISDLMRDANEER